MPAAKGSTRTPLGPKREKNAIYRGHLRLCQQPRAAYTLRSVQLLLSVHKRCSRLAALGELGRYPLLISSVKHCLKYEWHLVILTRTVLSVRPSGKWELCHTLTPGSAWLSLKRFFFPRTLYNKHTKQVGAELCQAQKKLGLVNCGCLSFTLKLRSSSIYIKIEVVFHLP
jgi:hypothetical protein